MYQKVERQELEFSGEKWMVFFYSGKASHLLSNQPIPIDLDRASNLLPEHIVLSWHTLITHAYHPAKFFASARRMYKDDKPVFTLNHRIENKSREPQNQVFVAINEERPDEPLAKYWGSCAGEMLIEIHTIYLRLDTDGFEKFPIADSRGVKAVR
ncbi:hypothetical protein BDR22DRAFT_971392 [Usnea florida]